MSNTTLNILTLIGGFIASIIIEMVILPRIILIAKKRRLFDMPDQRKKHDSPIPRLGGVSFMLVILLVSFFLLFVRYQLGLWDEHFIYDILPEWALFICGVCMIYLVGVKDDMIGVAFNKKFLIQFAAALCIVGNGTYINNLHGLFGIHEISPLLGVPLSILAIMFITNAINLIDGADGLASGLSALAFLVYGILFGMFGMWTYAGVAFVSLGMLAVFFYYNFIHLRRKIFMGDTGSLTLGYILAFMMIRLSCMPPQPYMPSSGFVLLLFAAVFIPPVDAFRVMVLRMISGKHPFTPDRSHIHHKLLDLGFSRRRAVFAIINCEVLILAINVLLLYFVDCNLVLLLDVCIWIGCTALIYKLISKKEKAAQLNTAPAE